MRKIIDKCPNCGQSGLFVFYSINETPSNSCICLNSVDQAVSYPTGRINLGFCKRCNFICNTCFDPDLVEYSDRYQDQQIFSGTFSHFLEGLAETLVKNYDLNNKTVIEIGCGKGDFLAALCARGKNMGIGIDPAAPTNKNSGNGYQNIQFIHELYSEKHASCSPDFICCRHTLEHINDTENFISLLRKTITRKDVHVFFEVPNAHSLVENIAFQDIYYEHCSYFTSESICYLFESNGFSVDRIETAYDDQYLLLHASVMDENGFLPSPHAHENRSLNVTDIEKFNAKARNKIKWWRKIVKERQEKNKNIILWGSGSKCTSFLKAIDVSTEGIFIVDINPSKQNKYGPGIGILIESPDILKVRKIDTVIIMNSMYLDEISSQIRSYNQNPEYFTI